MARLSDLGEKRLVTKIIDYLDAEGSLGLGDDAAVLDMGDRYLVVSTDLISHGSHMPPAMTNWQMGWMVSAVNHSDIAAMGASPLGLVLAMALPAMTSVDSLMAMIRGGEDCCRSVGSALIGGDTKESDELVLAGTAVGEVSKGELLTRAGARPGDLLAVTGPLGKAAAGFHAIHMGIDYPNGKKALMEPIPRVREGRILASSGMVTSCMDISDGLASSVHQLSASSGVSFKLVRERVPMDPDAASLMRDSEMGLDEVALYYGGDYQLLFTFRPEGERALKEKLPEMAIIGSAKEVGENILCVGEENVPLLNRGYEHFGRRT